jgi:hypothetical protein
LRAKVLEGPSDLRHGSEHRDMLSLGPTSPNAYAFLEFDALALLQRLDILIIDVRDVDENIVFPVVASDEAKALCLAEKLHSARTHFDKSFFSSFAFAGRKATTLPDP